jgi:hypothetical protein
MTHSSNFILLTLYDTPHVIFERIEFKQYININHIVSLQFDENRNKTRICVHGQWWWFDGTAEELLKIIEFRDYNKNFDNALKES